MAKVVIVSSSIRLVLTIHQGQTRQLEYFDPSIRASTPPGAWIPSQSPCEVGSVHTIWPDGSLLEVRPRKEYGLTEASTNGRYFLSESWRGGSKARGRGPPTIWICRDGTYEILEGHGQFEPLELLSAKSPWTESDRGIQGRPLEHRNVADSHWKRTSGNNMVETLSENSSALADPVALIRGRLDGATGCANRVDLCFHGRPRRALGALSRGMTERDVPLQSVASMEESCSVKSVGAGIRATRPTPPHDAPTLSNGRCRRAFSEGGWDHCPGTEHIRLKLIRGA